MQVARDSVPAPTEANNLSKACAAGNVEAVKRILALADQRVLDAQLRQIDREGRNPLHHAVASNKTACVRLLLAQTTDTDLENGDREGETPLFHAVKNRETKFEIIKLLVCDDNADGEFLELRNDHKNRAGVPLLHQAVMSNRLAVVKLLVDGNYDSKVREKDNDGNTWLHAAVLNQVDDDMIDYILSYPFTKADKENKYGQSPFIKALYGENEEHSFRLMKKLLPKILKKPLQSPSFYKPAQILEPAFIAIRLAVHRKGDPQKWCNYFLDISGYFCNIRNEKHQMLMFFLENYQAGQAESSNDWYKLVYYLFQFALHHDVWPGWWQKFREESSSGCYWISQDDVLRFIVRKGPNSDAHLKFAICVCENLGCDLTEYDFLLERLHDWLQIEDTRSVDHLERITKLLNFFRTNMGINFDSMFSEHLFKPWNSSTKAALRMLAPFCLELQLKSFNSDNLTNAYLSTMVEIAEATKGDERESFLPPIPSESVATLKFLSRKAILRTHEQKLDQYLKNMAKMELPQVLLEYLCFKQTRSDYLNVFN